MEPHPISDTPANFFVMGGVGTGKTVTLRLLMQSVLTHIGFGFDHRALVFDAWGTMVSLLHSMDLRCPLHILNPFDCRGAAWDIAADVASPLAAQQLAASLIPKEMSAQPFFTDAARLLLAAVCLSFIKTASRKWTLRDLLLAGRSRERLLSLSARTPESAAAVKSCLDGEHICANVIATIATKLQPFEVAASCWQHATSKMSLERWVRDESVIVLGSGHDPILDAAAQAINQVIFGCIADRILRHQESTARRTWIFLDDVCTAGRLDSLPALMQRGRSRGVCVALGAAHFEEIRRRYDSQAAEEITASCSHKAALHTDNPEMAAWAKRHFGPPLRASDLMSLPRSGPANGLSGYFDTPKAGTHLAHKSWDWVLANLQPQDDTTPDRNPRPEREHQIEDWTDEDYRRLGFDDPPPDVNT